MGMVITCTCGAVYESDYPCACPACGLNRCGACENGLVDSGGVTPWGSSIDVSCPDCKGTGVLPRNPDAVRIEAESYRQYVSVFGDILSPVQRRLLIERVRENRITRAAWRDALSNWKLNGYSPRNISGMIEYARARPAGNVGPVLKREEQIDERDVEQDVPSVIVKIPKKVLEWDE